MTVMFALGALAGLTFMTLYAIKAWGRWYRYRTGWHLMTMTLAVTVAFGGMLYDSIFHVLGKVTWFLIVLGVVVSMWHQVYLLLVTTRISPDNGMRRRSTD